MDNYFGSHQKITKFGDEFDGMTTAEKWQMREYITYHTMIEDILIDPMNSVAQAA